MNGENNGAYTLFGKDIVNIKNVTITGNKDLQSVFDIGNDLSETQIVNAKKLNATLNDKSIFMNLHDSGTQTVTLSDSKIKAGYGLHVVPFGDEHTVTLNLHNTELNTTRALISINDPNFPVDEEDEETETDGTSDEAKPVVTDVKEETTPLGTRLPVTGGSFGIIYILIGFALSVFGLKKLKER